MVGILNKKSFTKAGLDEASYVALAGFVRNDIHGRIRKALKEKFGDLARPGFIPSKSLTPRPQDFITYSYLFKNMEFRAPFERIKTPLVFGGTKVACFGMDQYRSAHKRMYPQVLILDYKSPDDFVIELKTKSKGDRVILAKIQPKATLAATIASVKARATPAAAEQAIGGDILKVPKFNFDITRSYREVQGRLLVLRNTEVAKDLRLLSAVQNIRFEMDEKGVKLRSEGHMAFGCAAECIPRPQHIMIFDKPFLIMLTRVNAKLPYFALWVDSPELLVRR